MLLLGLWNAAHGAYRYRPCSPCPPSQHKPWNCYWDRPRWKASIRRAPAPRLERSTTGWKHSLPPAAPAIYPIGLSTLEMEEDPLLLHHRGPRRRRSLRLCHSIFASQTTPRRPYSPPRPPSDPPAHLTL